MLLLELVRVMGGVRMRLPSMSKPDRCRAAGDAVRCCDDAAPACAWCRRRPAWCERSSSPTPPVGGPVPPPPLVVLFAASCCSSIREIVLLTVTSAFAVSGSCGLRDVPVSAKNAPGEFELLFHPNDIYCAICTRNIFIVARVEAAVANRSPMTRGDHAAIPELQGATRPRDKGLTAACRSLRSASICASCSPSIFGMPQGAFLSLFAKFWRVAWSIQRLDILRKVRIK